MDRSSTSNSSTRACTAAGSSDAMLAWDAPVHPVRNLMRRATMARKFACFSWRAGRMQPLSFIWGEEGRERSQTKNVQVGMDDNDAMTFWTFPMTNRQYH
eukprot:scaffold84168_cov39-Attheya_sp.AAC.7